MRIERSERRAPLGANGLGKRTRHSIITAYELPSRGRVTVLGEEYGRCDMTATKRRIGLVGATIHPWLPREEPAEEVAASGLHALVGHSRDSTDEERARGRAALAAVSADA